MPKLVAWLMDRRLSPLTAVDRKENARPRDIAVRKDNHVHGPDQL